MTTLMIEIPVPKRKIIDLTSLVIHKINEVIAEVGTCPYLVTPSRTRDAIRFYAFSHLKAPELYHRIGKPLELLVANGVVPLGFREPEELHTYSWSISADEAYYVVVSEKELTFEKYTSARRV